MPSRGAAVADAVAFYTALGKVARVLKKEIQGFVVNRLQRAIMREACYLVQQGVVSVADLDVASLPVPELGRDPEGVGQVGEHRVGQRHDGNPNASRGAGS